MCDNKTTSDKHDEVIAVRASKWWVVLFLLLLLLLTCILIKPDALRDKPVTSRELLLFRLWGLSMAAFCLWGLLSALRFRLTLLPDGIVLRKFFFVRRFPLDKIEQLVWYTNKKYKGMNRVLLKVRGHKEFQIDTIFALSSYKNIVCYLRTTIPLEDQVGWKEYYLQKRSEWVRLSFKEELTQLLTNFEELKKFANQIRCIVLLFCGFIGGAFLFGALGVKLASFPKLLSGIVVFILTSCLFYILWKIHRGHGKTNSLIFLAMKDTVAIYCMAWIAGTLLGGIWDWWGSNGLRATWAWGFVFLVIGVLVVGGIASGRQIKKEDNEKPRSVPEPKKNEYEKYAELLLPPELER